MTQHIIQCVTRLQDNQDGGYTMFVYNNEEEMLKDHPLVEGPDEPLTEEPLKN